MEKGTFIKPVVDKESFGLVALILLQISGVLH